MEDCLTQYVFVSIIWEVIKLVDFRPCYTFYVCHDQNTELKYICTN